MNNQTEFNSFSVIKFSWKWRKLLIIITLASGILGFLFAMIIKPMYKSTAIVYATHYNSFLFYNEDIASDMKKYGEEYETEQLIQILQSREFKDTLVNHFNLIEYYGIDTLKKHWTSELYKELEDNIQIKRTQFGGISIAVDDPDPQHAAMLANAIVDNLDMFKGKVERERAQAVCDLIQNQIDEVHAKMVIVNDSVQKLADEGIFIYDLQVERVIQQYATVLGQGNTAGAQRLQKEIAKIAKLGPTSVVLREELIYLVRRETQLKSMLWNAEMNASASLPSKFVVEKATPIDKKVYPKKSLFGLFSAMGAFIFTFFALLGFEKIKVNLSTLNDEK
jgi:capsular polysaccharide biosynthesis protein